MEVDQLISRVRMNFGDPGAAFRNIMQGDGIIQQFDLEENHINPSGFVVQFQNGPDVTTLQPSVDFNMNYELGQLFLTNPVPNGAVMVVQGTANSMWSDYDVVEHARDAINWHCHNRTIRERYLNRQGFIEYRETPINITNLPGIEEMLLVDLVVLFMFYTMSNDIATDTDVSTAEGTNLNRAQRFSQVMEQIGILEKRYKDYCGQLNVGPFRWESLNVRRVSATTGRLVPLYREREYDEHAYPTRLVPPIDSRYQDNSGIPSQLYYGGGTP